VAASGEASIRIWSLSTLLPQQSERGSIAPVSPTSIGLNVPIKNTWKYIEGLAFIPKRNAWQLSQLMGSLYLIWHRDE